MADRRTHGMTGQLLARAVGASRRVSSPVLRASRRRALPAVLAVTAALLAATCGWLGIQVHRQHQEAQRDQDVLASARQFAVDFTSLDYRRYDRESADVLAGATGEFKKEFANQTKQLTKLVAENKSVSQGQVLDAGIVRVDDRSARVLVVADSEVTNVAAPQGQTRNYRLQLDLVRVGGRWLTSGVEFVG
jgi:Mce-associated membrane protein